MTKFTGFVKKEFLHIMRDKRTMLILFGIPVAMMLLFGFVISNEIKEINIAVLDNSHDKVSREITNRLTSSGHFKLHSVLLHQGQINEVFKVGTVKQVIIFSPNLAKNIEKGQTGNIQIIADASDANLANLITNYAKGIIMDYQKSLAPPGVQMLQIKAETRMVYNPELKSVFLFVPGTMAMILMLISALMTSISIVREKETGTMEVLLVSPLKPLEIIVGKTIPYVLLSFINAGVVVLLGYLVFGLPVKGSIVLLLAECMLFICLALSLGILISTVTESQQLAMMISMVALLLPTILLSGFIFPIENMPKILQWLCAIMPPKYFIIIVKNIMLKGTGLAYIWHETLILGGFTLFFIAMAAKKFQVRLR